MCVCVSSCWVAGTIGGDTDTVIVILWMCDRWYVQLAAMWHWYLSWCIYITVFNFILCLSIPFLYFSLIWYRWIRQNGWWYQQLFKNLCLMFVYVCFMFVIWLERGLICGKSLEMWICLWPEFDCPEVTLCGWQDIKIQLLTTPCDPSACFYSTAHTALSVRFYTSVVSAYYEKYNIPRIYCL